MNIEDLSAEQIAEILAAVRRSIEAMDALRHELDLAAEEANPRPPGRTVCCFHPDMERRAIKEATTNPIADVDGHLLPMCCCWCGTGSAMLQGVHHGPAEDHGPWKPGKALHFERWQRRQVGA